MLRSHDASHVVFGLGTSLRDEIAADFVALLATDVGLGCYVRCVFLSPEGRAQTRAALGHPLALLLAGGRATPLALRLIWRALRRRPRWPWRISDELFERPLCELRARFGIPLLGPPR